MVFASIDDFEGKNTTVDIMTDDIFISSVILFCFEGYSTAMCHCFGNWGGIFPCFEVRLNLSSLVDFLASNIINIKFSSNVTPA